jgi:hypothetical protein
MMMSRAKTATKAPKAAQAEKVSRAKTFSALDAASQVLSESKQPMTCGALIEAMAAKKLWTSPGGKTPQATLASAIQREITAKGKESRFAKTGRGLFAAKG